MADIRKSRLFGASSIGFFGVGKTTLALINLLKKWHPCAKITLRSEGRVDRSALPEGVSPRLLEGTRAFDTPYEELLVCSPSVRRERGELIPFLASGTRLTSDCELFFEICDKPTLAVTGSDGKSTTATLAHRILQGAGRSAALIGNIGVPMLPTVGRAESYVCELSSFNLHYLKASFKRAAVTNITPNHLNFHGTMEEYTEAKLSALRSADEPIVFDGGGVLSDFVKSAPVYAICSYTRDLRELSQSYRAEVIYTVSDGYIKRCGEKLVPISAFPSPSENLIKNFTVAAALTEGLCDTEDLIRVAREFTGLPHRAECFLKVEGKEFIDSSIDTSPARSISTITAQSRPTVVMLGGRGKGVSYAPLREALLGRARLAVLFGEDRLLIKEAIGDTVPCVSFKGFREGVEFALSVLGEGETLLLSPAATSYDEFSSFEERGNLFKKIIREHYSDIKDTEM